MTTRPLALGTSIALVLGATLVPLAATAEQPERVKFREGVLLVKPRTGLPSDQLDKELKKHGGQVDREVRGTKVKRVKVAPGREAEVANALNRNPLVEFAELDLLVTPDAVVNDPNYASQWYLPLMRAPSAWTYANGRGVTVAICDTGVNASHPDLAGQTVAGWNTVSNTVDTADVNGHGTWVSGIVAAAANNLVGGASVAPGARVMTMRITDRSDGYAYASDMAECVTWAADHGARVANISFSGVAGSATVASAGSYMQSKTSGVVVVSAGNNGADMGYANSPYLFTAAATTSADARASYSNFGAYVDIAAPGSSIYTTNRSGGYSSVSGTSFASPDAAAVAALVMSANPGLTATDVTSILTNTAKDLGTAGWDAYYGFGRVDAAAAVAMAASVANSDRTAPSVAVVTPSSAATVSRVVTVDVQARDDFGVTSVDLLVDGTLLGTDTSDDPTAPYVYRFAWDSTRVANGTHQLTAKARDATGNVGSTQAVTVTVSNTGDTTPPVITSVRPSTGTKVTGTSTVLSATASDNVAVAGMTISVNGFQCSSAKRSVYCAWDLTNVAAGSYTMTTTATDTARNRTVKTATFRVVK